MPVDIVHARNLRPAAHANDSAQRSWTTRPLNVGSRRGGGSALSPYTRAVDADQVIAALGLSPHPEGGWFAETWREAAPDGERAASSAIYFLLRAGGSTRWHRVDAAEAWHHYVGAPVELRIAESGQATTVVRLGPDIEHGERPQAIVPAGAWQAARTLGAWTLVGCTVAPAFEAAGFELAPEGWEPGWLEQDARSDRDDRERDS